MGRPQRKEHHHQNQSEKEAKKSHLRLVHGGPRTVPENEKRLKPPLPPHQSLPDQEPTTEPGPDDVGDTRPDVSLRTVGIFLFGFLATLAALFTFSATPGQTMPSELKTFQRLHDIYRQNGMEAFLESKKQLRTQVERVMKENRSNDAYRAASNIALYLFPELLSDDDLEKGEAAGGWTKLQHAIEQAPKQAESRLWFEELRANIWNYENVDRNAPKLTQYGRQCLQIYDVLTAR